MCKPRLSFPEHEERHRSNMLKKPGNGESILAAVQQMSVGES